MCRHGVAEFVTSSVIPFNIVIFFFRSNAPLYIIISNDNMKKLLIFLLISYGLIGCATLEVKTVDGKYDRAMQLMDQALYSSAIPIFEEIIKENPGTKYATYSYLKLGDANLESGSSKYSEAEKNYRIFLSYSPHSHLVPYIMSRLIELNYKKSGSILFGEDYTYSRDPEHFKRIINEYQRFFLMYPHSLHLEDARVYMEKSKEALAWHEFLIGNWYYEQNYLRSAIERYRYLLKNYPTFSQSEQVVKKLIKAYKTNQREDLAEELERITQKKS